jgi:hypothetical protein
MEPNQVNMVDAAVLEFVSLKVVYGRTHCHDTKSLWPAKYLVFLDINIKNLNAESLVDCFGGTICNG